MDVEVFGTDVGCKDTGDDDCDKGEGVGDDGKGVGEHGECRGRNVLTSKDVDEGALNVNIIN